MLLNRELGAIELELAARALLRALDSTLLDDLVADVLDRHLPRVVIRTEVVAGEARVGVGVDVVLGEAFIGCRLLRRRHVARTLLTRVSRRAHRLQ